MEREPEYRLAAEVGDLVYLPSGDLGVIADSDILNGGNTREIVVFPFAGSLRRMWLFFVGRIRYYDNEINSLRLIARLAPTR